MQIRTAEEMDIPAILCLLKQVNELHAKARPDLFRLNTKYDSDGVRAHFRPVEARFCVRRRRKGKRLRHLHVQRKLWRQLNAGHQNALHRRYLCRRKRARQGSGKTALQRRGGFCKSFGLLQRNAKRLGVQSRSYGVLQKVRACSAENYYGKNTLT